MVYFILFFTVVPIIELILLFQVGSLIGSLPTIMLILCTGVVGATLAKIEGLSTWKKIQSHLAQGSIPGRELLNGLLILIGAAFLITPGVLTDFFGLAMLLPGSRDIFREFVIWFCKKHTKFHMQMHTNVQNFSARPNGEIIEGEIISQNEDKE